MLSFLLFGDGGAAALVTADPHGIALRRFPRRGDPRQPGSDHLADRRPGLRHAPVRQGARPRSPQALREERARDDADGLLRGEGTQAIDLWAVHAGGRTVLDAVEIGLDLDRRRWRHSRAVLRDFGNMSSATVMFVLRAHAGRGATPGSAGMAMAFGPGMVAETFRFSLA